MIPSIDGDTDVDRHAYDQTIYNELKETLVTNFMDPPAVEEGAGGDYIKAKDLKNRVVVLRPNGLNTEPGKDGKPWTYIEADVWVLETHGVVETGTNVRFSWWRAVSQLKSCIGELVACKPTELDDNSVELMPLTGNAREVAEAVSKRISSGEDVQAEVF